MVFFLLLEGRFGRVKSVRVCLDAACLFFLCRLSEIVLRRSLDQLVMQLIDRVTELAENGAEDVTGVRTGFYDMDRMTAGLQGGDLIILAARPSMGKTAFALNIAENVAVNEGLPVVVFSMVMGASQLALRMVGSLGRIPVGALTDRYGGRIMFPLVSAINLDSVENLPTGWLVERLGRLSGDRMREVCVALTVATDC